MSDVVTGLNVPQTVFCLFYAIFLGLVSNAQIRWKAFDWPMALKGRSDPQYAPTTARTKQSIAYLMILPIALFLAMAYLLGLVPPRPLGFQLALQLLGGIVAAHSAFAPYRLWLGRIEASGSTYYYRVSDAKPPKGASDDWGLFSSQPDGADRLPIDLQWSKGNRVVACIYVGIAGGFALLTWLLG